MKTGMVGAGGYGHYGGPIFLFEGYKEWLNDPESQREVSESGSTSDFVTYLSRLQNFAFFDRYHRADSNWRQWTRVMSVKDYTELATVSLTGFPRLMEIPEGGEYWDSGITDVPGPKIQIKKFGLRYTITRETIINDDLNKLGQLPEMMAEAALMTQAIHIVQETLEANPTAYDGTAFFHATHNNLIVDPLSEAGLQNAISLMRAQKDTEGFVVSVRPAVLVVPTGLEFTARRIIASGLVPQPGNGLVGVNVLEGIVEPVVEPYLTDVNNWFLFADPNSTRPAMAVAFLNGMEDPQVMVANPEMRLVMGGLGNQDPYSWLFDELKYKVRHEHAARMWEFRSAIKANVP